ncbi:MAG: hypothetical protein JWR74_52 [Polaromonas sp.]|nr:hypothetical protein [Polaromonas sp.]
MFHTLAGKLYSPSLGWCRAAAACACVGAITACGGGDSDALASNGSSVGVNAAVSARITEDASENARQLAPPDPVMESENLAMKKIAQMKCDRLATKTPDAAVASSRQNIRQSACDAANAS